MKNTTSVSRSNVRKVLTAAVLVAGMTATALGGCGGGACAELDSKKSECSRDGNKELCEKAVAAAVQADNADACKTMLDNMAKKK